MRGRDAPDLGERGVADYDPALPELAGQPRDDDVQRVGVAAVEQRGERGDLVVARAGTGHAIVGRHDLVEPHRVATQLGRRFLRWRSGSRDSHTNSSGSSIAVRNPPLPQPVSMAITCSPAHRSSGFSGE